MTIKCFGKQWHHFSLINLKASNKITLSENEKLITNDQKTAEVFNNYFNSIVEELNIPIDQNLLNDASLFDDPIIAAILNYKRHPSILKIKKQLKKKFYHVFIMFFLSC